MRTIARRLLIALLPVALLVLTAPAVLAYNWPQDGTDPYGTGCARNSWTVYSVWTGSGTLNLKFSNSCATAWGEFTCWTPGGCSNFTQWAYRYPDSKTMTNYVSWPWWVVPYGATIHTLQMFDGYNYWVDTCVQGYWGGAMTCTGGY